jgi:hypothetical protein
MATLANRPAVVQVGDGSVYRFLTEADAAEFESKAKLIGSETVRLEPAAPLAARGLYDIEQHLAALIDTEDTVTPEQEEEYRQEFERVLLTAIDKRDRVGQFLAHCEAQVTFAEVEIKRLTMRKQFFTSRVEKLEQYISHTIISLGKDAKGQWKKLEGQTVTFSLRRNPPSVEITDEAAVPHRVKNATVTMPAEIWDSVLDSLDMALAERVVETIRYLQYHTSKTMAKAAIEATVPDWKQLLEEQDRIITTELPGAAIIQKTRLVRA